MNKKEIIKTLDIASFISVVLATLLVFVFQFTGSYLIMKYSIVMYVVTFLTLTIVFAIRVHSAFARKAMKLVDDKDNLENVSEIDTKQTSIQSQSEMSEIDSESIEKRDKIVSILRVVLSSIALVFTTLLLVIY